MADYQGANQRLFQRLESVFLMLYYYFPLAKAAHILTFAVNTFNCDKKTNDQSFQIFSFLFRWNALLLSIYFRFWAKGDRGSREKDDFRAIGRSANFS